MHEGVKEIQYLRHLMRQLGLSDVNNPTPVLNDNKGSVDWVESGCKATPEHQWIKYLRRKARWRSQYSI